MPNLALLILITVFLTQGVSWIGKTVLQDFAFSTYSRIFLSSKSKQQRILRKQVLQDKAELARTSSQDEFAKWARLRRKVDKSLADLEKISTSTRYRAQLGTVHLLSTFYLHLLPLPSTVWNQTDDRHHPIISSKWIQDQIRHISMDNNDRNPAILGMVV